MIRRRMQTILQGLFVLVFSCCSSASPSRLESEKRVSIATLREPESGGTTTHSEETEEEQWSITLINGLPVARNQIVTTRNVDLVQTVLTQADMVRIEGHPRELTTVYTAIETIDGRPVSFMLQETVADHNKTVTGTVTEDGVAHVQIKENGKQIPSDVELEWPRGCLLPEGLLLLWIRKGFTPQIRYRAHVFDPLSMDCLEVEYTVKGARQFDALGRKEHGFLMLGDIISSQGAFRFRVWVDDAHRTLRMSHDYLGYQVDSYTVDRATALQPLQLRPDLLQPKP
jgi:hypothetical protein